MQRGTGQKRNMHHHHTITRQCSIHHPCRMLHLRQCLLPPGHILWREGGVGAVRSGQRRSSLVEDRGCNEAGGKAGSQHDHTKVSQLPSPETKAAFFDVQRVITSLFA